MDPAVDREALAAAGVVLADLPSGWEVEDTSTGVAGPMAAGCGYLRDLGVDGGPLVRGKRRSFTSGGLGDHVAASLASFGDAAVAADGLSRLGSPATASCIEASLRDAAARDGSRPAIVGLDVSRVDGVPAGAVAFVASIQLDDGDGGSTLEVWQAYERVGRAIAVVQSTSASSSSWPDLLTTILEHVGDRLKGAFS